MKLRKAQKRKIKLKQLKDKMAVKKYLGRLGKRISELKK